jgi:predicted RNase H-like nuclease (RuvC/YqgF family)
MPEDKKRSGVKICGWISDEVFSKLNELGYKSPTVIIRRGVELIIGQPIGEHGELTQGTSKGTTENTGEQPENTREQNRELMEQIREQREQIREQREHIETLKAELEKAPDPLEFSHLHVRSEELETQIKAMEENLRKAPDPIELATAQERLEGLQRLLEEKDKTIEILNRDFENLNVFAHYFKNVEVKQIEAPGKKKWWEFWK